MDGWVGTFWDLKHTGVTPDLDAILAQDQGRVLFFAMPAIRRTSLTVWQPGARRWRRGHRGSNPCELSVEDRRADLGARSAYIVSIWDTIERRPDVQADHCRCCGVFTASWCEGCYFRRPESFGAVCAECDHLHLVCDQCRFDHISWEQGHAAYIEEGGQDTEDQVEITGWGDRANSPHFEATSSQVSIEEVAQILGISAQQARDLLKEQLSGTTQAASSGSSATGPP